MEALRSQLRTFLRIVDTAPTTTLSILEQMNDGDVSRKLVTYTAVDGELIQAFLFEPPAASRGAVLVLHQHGSDWSLGKSEVAGLGGDPLQAFGPVLAQAGMIVLAPDALGFESRRGSAGSGGHVPPPPLERGAAVNDWLQYYNHAMHRLVRGELLMTKLLADVASAISALRTIALGASVGVAGHSFGGNLSLFASALDTRISFAVSSGAVCSFRHKLMHGTGLEMALVIPGLASRFDVDDLVRCVAPRELLVVSSDEDPLSADAGDVVSAAAPAFVEAGVAGRLSHFRGRGGHALDRARFDAIVDWLSTRAL